MPEIGVPLENRTPAITLRGCRPTTRRMGHIIKHFHVTYSATHYFEPFRVMIAINTLLSTIRISVHPCLGMCLINWCRRGDSNSTILTLRKRLLIQLSFFCLNYNVFHGDSLHIVKYICPVLVSLVH